jgi:glycine/D-amino acid oxidase-like deaminating enzyme
MRALFARRHPRLAEAPTAQSWNGAIDRSRLGLPLFGRLPNCPDVFYGFGYSGRGVLTTVLGGRILASLVRDADDEWANAGLVRPLHRDFPPEPLRYFGAVFVRGAIRRKDRLDDEGRRLDPVTRAFYSLKPGGWTGTDPMRHIDKSEQ